MGEAVYRLSTPVLHGADDRASASSYAFVRSSHPDSAINKQNLNILFVLFAKPQASNTRSTLYVQGSIQGEGVVLFVVLRNTLNP
jgi:hypothetical protein